jgi:hypothetical protein
MNASTILSSAIVWWAITLGIGYTVGRIGIPTLYQDIKHLIQGIKGAAVGAEKAVVGKTPAPVPAPTPVKPA